MFIRIEGRDWDLPESQRVEARQVPALVAQRSDNKLGNMMVNFHPDSRRGLSNEWYDKNPLYTINAPLNNEAINSLIADPWQLFVVWDGAIPKPGVSDTSFKTMYMSSFEPIVKGPGIIDFGSTA